MTDRNDATIGAPEMQRGKAERRPWHAPEFSVLDVEATENNAPAGGPDSGNNNMS